MTASKKFQVGVVGYGLSAKVFQIPNILASPAFELRAIVQPEGNGRTAHQDHPTCTVYSDADSLFNDVSIDLVVLSTPPPTHFELASRALNAGKNVVVEKPFAPTTEECNKLIDLAKKSNTLLTVFQNRRWDSDFLTLQKVISDGSLGRVVEFETHFDRYDPEIPHTWAGKVQPGSGVIYDLGTHLIDQVLVLYGMPSRITGFLGSQRSGNTQGLQDACTVLLHYDSGLLVTVKASAVSPETEQLRYWVRGDRGGFRKCHLDPQEPQIVAGMKPTDPQFGVEDVSHAGSLVEFKDGKLVKTTVPTLPPSTYRRFYDILATALEGKGDVPVTPEAARDVIKLVELAAKSSVEGVSLAVD